VKKLVMVLVLVVLLGGVVEAQSPLPTQVGLETPTPGSGGGGGEDGGGGTVEFPEIEFDPVVMAVILGLVQYAKQLGVNGKASLGLSMGLGVALGGSAWLASQGAPGDFGGWFVALIVGLAYGLAASGLYDLGKQYTAGGRTVAIKGP